MPCSSEGYEPNKQQKELQKAASLLVYVCNKLGKKPEEWTVLQAGMTCADDERCVTELCAELKKMDKDQLEAIVYNAHDQTARNLAAWWEEHQKADATREEKEHNERNGDALRKEGLSKLSDAEKIALQLKE